MVEAWQHLTRRYTMSSNPFAGWLLQHPTIAAALHEFGVDGSLTDMGFAQVMADGSMQAELVEKVARNSWQQPGYSEDADLRQLQRLCSRGGNTPPTFVELLVDAADKETRARSADALQTLPSSGWAWHK